MNPLYRCAFDRKKCFGYKPPPVEEHEEHSYCSETNVRRSPPAPPRATPAVTHLCGIHSMALVSRAAGLAGVLQPD